MELRLLELFGAPTVPLLWFFLGRLIFTDSSAEELDDEDDTDTDKEEAGDLFIY